MVWSRTDSQRRLRHLENAYAALGVKSVGRGRPPVFRTADTAGDRHAPPKPALIVLPLIASAVAGAGPGQHLDFLHGAQPRAVRGLSRVLARAASWSFRLVVADKSLPSAVEPMPCRPVRCHRVLVPVDRQGAEGGDRQLAQLSRGVPCFEEGRVFSRQWPVSTTNRRAFVSSSGRSSGGRSASSSSSSSLAQGSGQPHSVHST